MRRERGHKFDNKSDLTTLRLNTKLSWLLALQPGFLLDYSMFNLKPLVRQA